MTNMPIKCDYYSFNYDHLEIAYEKGVTATASNRKLTPGDLLIVCASQTNEHHFYAFLAEAGETITGKTSKDYWPKFHRDVAVTRITPLTPIAEVPQHRFGRIYQCGLTAAARPAVMSYLKGAAMSAPVRSVEPEVKVEVQPQVITHTQPKPIPVKVNGFVYIIKDKQLGGYKVGTTIRLDKRYKQLRVPGRATEVGHWITDEYAHLETFIHRYFEEKNIPQSEWFNLSSDELKWVIDFLNDKATPGKDNKTAYAANNIISAKSLHLTAMTAALILAFGVLLPQVYSALPIATTNIQAPAE